MDFPYPSSSQICPMSLPIQLHLLFSSSCIQTTITKITINQTTIKQMTNKEKKPPSNNTKEEQVHLYWPAVLGMVPALECG